MIITAQQAYENYEAALRQEKEKELNMIVPPHILSYINYRIQTCSRQGQTGCFYLITQEDKKYIPKIIELLKEYGFTVDTVNHVKPKAYHDEIDFRTLVISWQHPIPKKENWFCSICHNQHTYPGQHPGLFSKDMFCLSCNHITIHARKDDPIDTIDNKSVVNCAENKPITKYDDLTPAQKEIWNQE